jgi:hypothetical protein
VPTMRKFRSAVPPLFLCSVVRYLRKINTDLPLVFPVGLLCPVNNNLARP